MREILFRGKTKTGIWIEGFLFQTECDGVKEWNISMSPLSANDYSEILGDYGDVIPETVGQYTGLTDKNGTKIFEGDIVAGALYWLEQNKNGVVTFRDGSFGLLWYRGEAEQFNPFTSMCNITYEVIGNIHDNHELLKGGAE